jgi:ABC-type transport system involved in multi-copper enzyme maturation permease subunit
MSDDKPTTVNMSPILWISLNTVREHLRDKLFYNLAFFALLLIASAVVLSRLTIGDYHRVLIDVGLASIDIIGVMIAVFLGIGLLNRELERRTLYLVLSKPVPRSSLVLGKYLGLLLTLSLNILLLFTGLLSVLWMTGVPVTAGLFQAALATHLECAVVTAMAMVFSAFTTATLSAMCTFSLFVVGHNITTLRVVAEKSEEAIRMVMTGFIYVLPDLEHFNLRSHAVHEATVPALNVLMVGGYACMYATVLLGLAIALFNRRDIP